MIAVIGLSGLVPVETFWWPAFTISVVDDYISSVELG